MNQILDYNPNKSSGGGSSGSDKVTRVFALILICFSICLVGVGGYNLFNNKKNNAVPVQTATQAKIEVEQKDSVVAIRVSHDKTIEKLIYNWDSDKETTLKGDGQSTMEEEIPLLAGTHTLNIKVTDVDGVESTHQEEFFSETGEDKIFPVIALKVTDQKKLKITATDETEISYVTYRWNDEEETKVYPGHGPYSTVDYEKTHNPFLL